MRSFLGSGRMATFVAAASIAIAASDFVRTIRRFRHDTPICLSYRPPRASWRGRARWFDVFRTPAPYLLPVFRLPVASRTRRCQCRVNRIQIRRHKRKAFVQGLRA